MEPTPKELRRAEPQAETAEVVYAIADAQFRSLRVRVGTLSPAASPRSHLGSISIDPFHEHILETWFGILPGTQAVFTRVLVLKTGTLSVVH